MSEVQVRMTDQSEGERIAQIERQIKFIMAGFALVFLGIVPILAIAGAIVGTITFHAIRILGRNGMLKRFRKKWPEWRRAGVSPARVLWSFSSQSLTMGTMLAIALISAVLIGFAPRLDHFVPQHPVGEPGEYVGINEGTYTFWLVLFPGMVDMLWMLTGGVILDVAQWPKCNCARRRIVAQVAFGLCGCVVFTLVPPLATWYFKIKLIDCSIPYMFAMVILSSFIRAIFIRWQWRSGVRIMESEADWAEEIE